MKPSRLFHAARFLSTYYVPAAVLETPCRVCCSINTVLCGVVTQPWFSGTEMGSCLGYLAWEGSTVVSHSGTAVGQTCLRVPALALILWGFLEK